MHKFFFTAALFACLGNHLKAQGQTTQAASATNSSTTAQGQSGQSVVARVTELASGLNLSSAQQAALTAIFNEEQAALGGSAANDAVTEQVKAQLAARFQALLTPQQLADYGATHLSTYLNKTNYALPAGSPAKHR